MRPVGKKSSKAERNITEKYRRMQMKDLLSNLFHFVQIKPSGEKLPLLANLERATVYVKQLKVKVEKMKETKEQLLKGSERFHNTTAAAAADKDNAAILRVPVIEVKEMAGGSIFEVNVIIGMDKSFMLHQILSVLQEEGGEVMNATYSTVGDDIFYTIHFQALWSRLGMEVSKVQQRLMQLVFSTRNYINNN